MVDLLLHHTNQQIYDFLLQVLLVLELAVIAGVGNIRILGEAQSVSIYTVSGQAVAVNSSERTFSVAKGIYLVTVDGKTTKVLVK